ncbi:MAG: hypothetical protein IPF99_37645 [Deltaproteobacteria bacterium]|nr:hypothetical protein [Deltaproteobacteria bacterium]
MGGGRVRPLAPASFGGLLRVDVDADPRACRFRAAGTLLQPVHPRPARSTPDRQLFYGTGSCSRA